MPDQGEANKNVRRPRLMESLADYGPRTADERKQRRADADVGATRVAVYAVSLYRQKVQSAALWSDMDDTLSYALEPDTCFAVMQASAALQRAYDLIGRDLTALKHGLTASGERKGDGDGGV